jgi:hypothetical protein
MGFELMMSHGPTTYTIVRRFAAFAYGVNYIANY